jgi:hypothetical protein
MISAKRRQEVLAAEDIQLHVFDVARIESEVYWMESTQVKFRGARFAVESSVIAFRRRCIPQTSTPEPSRGDIQNIPD